MSEAAQLIKDLLIAAGRQAGRITASSLRVPTGRATTDLFIFIRMLATNVAQPFRYVLPGNIFSRLVRSVAQLIQQGEESVSCERALSLAGETCENETQRERKRERESERQVQRHRVFFLRVKAKAKAKATGASVK